MSLSFCLLLWSAILLGSVHVCGVSMFMILWDYGMRHLANNIHTLEGYQAHEGWQMIGSRLNVIFDALNFTKDYFLQDEGKSHQHQRRT